MTSFPNHSAQCMYTVFLGSPSLYSDRFGRTPLHLAAKRGHAEIASLLVKADAPLEAMETNYVSA